MLYHDDDLSETIHVRIPTELGRALRKAAARDERTLSSWVRAHLIALVDYRERVAEREGDEVPA
ncbi:MAG: hypothetical protein WD021_11055 [Rhodothermales bacterium]